MSKLDNSVISHLKMLSLDMINEAGSGDVELSLDVASLFNSLFMKHLNFNPKNKNWINRDRILVSNRFLPLLYASIHLFTKEISLDNLRDYKKLNSLCSGQSNMKTPFIEIGSMTSSDVISSASGIALGERYLESLVKLEKPKCELINFHTFCVCTEEDIMDGASYEALNYVSKEVLNKLIFIVIRENYSKSGEKKEINNQKLENHFASLNFNVEEINSNNISSIEGAIEDAKISKKPTILFIRVNNKESERKRRKILYNRPLSSEELAAFREENGFEAAFDIKEKIYSDIENNLNKRFDKIIKKWQSIKEESISDLKLKEIINFLETKDLKINFSADNIKINDNYEESLNISNSKIFNLFANKSPFILSGSDDNYVYTKANITKSGVMHKDTPTERNIDFGPRSLAMGGMACGLASLGFKVMISTPLINASKILSSIKLSTYNNLDVNYIFTQDTFLDTYENIGNASITELNTLRLIPNLINLRPSDINEILGVYEVINNTRKPCTITIGSEQAKKLLGTNSKYVMAGAYRVLKETEKLDAIIISSGSEVKIALKVAEELKQYGFDIRVVTMPSWELFDFQTDKYKNILLPKEVKTFVIEFGSPRLWHKYATGDEYILGIDEYTDSGTRAELLSNYNLDLDAIKTRIIEILKNN